MNIPRGHLDPIHGWYILYCPKCGYAVENCRRTGEFVICPVCKRQEIKTKLEDKFVRQCQ